MGLGVDVKGGLYSVVRNHHEVVVLSQVVHNHAVPQIIEFGQFKMLALNPDKRIPVRINEQRNPFGVGQVNELEHDVALVLEDLAEIIIKLLYLGHNRLLDLPQIFRSANGVCHQLFVDDYVFDRIIARYVHPPVLLIIHSPQHQKKLVLVPCIPRKAVVVARQIQVVDVELVNELVFDSLNINDAFCRFRRGQYDGLSLRQFKQVFLYLFQRPHWIRRQEALEIAGQERFMVLPVHHQGQ